MFCVTLVSFLTDDFFLFQLVVESSAGTAIAAAMSNKLRDMEPEIENVGVILSGGNADFNHLPWLENKNNNFI